MDVGLGPLDRIPTFQPFFSSSANLSSLKVCLLTLAIGFFFGWFCSISATICEPTSALPPDPRPPFNQLPSPSPRNSPLPSLPLLPPLLPLRNQPFQNLKISSVPPFAPTGQVYLESTVLRPSLRSARPRVASSFINLLLPTFNPPSAAVQTLPVPSRTPLLPPSAITAAPRTASHRIAAQRSASASALGFGGSPEPVTRPKRPSRRGSVPDL